ncbi:MAG: hypothetical protein OQJ99_09015 [Rhodospirillales bacterium]|nr:hypothetical protein [Rhodospirillales bacterium]MCW8863061.1 hypothetical protein [Rhodospirillales bacterium]MCW8951418.1 hypothetical protein [Rhodospirillales bacterium]MCW8970765.1 hypothetical protein [Rhodospirillales bacterium]MCW9001753.1 hypothetical protein [Rhodospirillales bacterium]
MSEQNGEGGTVHRLIPGGKDNSRHAHPEDSVETLRSDFSDLRDEIRRRDDILKMVLERLPTGAGHHAQDSEAESTPSLHRQLATAEAERDAAKARFRELRKLVSTLVGKAGNFIRPASEDPTVRMMKDEITSLRQDMSDGWEVLSQIQARLDAMDFGGIPSAGGASAHAISDSGAKGAGKNPFEALARDVAAMKDQWAADRAVIAEMRLDMNKMAAGEAVTPATHFESGASGEDAETRAQVSELRETVEDIRTRVVRFMLEQMRMGGKK